MSAALALERQLQNQRAERLALTHDTDARKAILAAKAVA